VPVLLITKLLYLYTNRKLLASSVDKGWSLHRTLYFGSQQKSLITFFFFFLLLFIFQNMEKYSEWHWCHTYARPTQGHNSGCSSEYGAYWSKDPLIDSWQFVKCYTFQFLIYKFQLNGNKRAIETTGTHMCCEFVAQNQTQFREQAKLFILILLQKIFSFARNRITAYVSMSIITLY